VYMAMPTLQSAAWAALTEAIAAERARMQPERVFFMLVSSSFCSGAVSHPWLELAVNRKRRQSDSAQI
jgi:hypothetical protein